MSIGVGQLIKVKDSPKNDRILHSYFCFFYAAIAVSTVISLILIVFIEGHLGWKVGFAIPAILTLLAVLAFYLGYRLFVRFKAETRLFTSLAQVMVVTIKNWSLPYPTNGEYHLGKEYILTKPSRHLRFLDKACIIRDRENDIKDDGSTAKPWNVCTVDQVEALKSLIRIIPIWSTGIITYMALTGGTISTMQAMTMDRHLTKNFKIPADTFILFSLVTLIIWVALYEKVITPLLANYTGRTRGFNNIICMGMGHVVAILAMVIAAIVEIIRRKKALEQGLADNPHGIVRMSAFWLVPQFLVGGLAEGLNVVGQIEFYYAQLPKNMASLVMALFSLNSAFAGLLGTLVVETVDKVTSGDRKESWVANNPNKGHYHYYYWFIALLCVVNFIYYIVCCWAYGPTEEVTPKIIDEKAEGSPIHKDMSSSTKTT